MTAFDTTRRAGKLLQIGAASRRMKKASDDAERTLARARLAELLSDARGVPMKVGQFLSANADENDPMHALVTSIEPWPLADVLPEMERQLGFTPERELRNLKPSTAAASLGQVHQAELVDGTPVAVKVRYPDIAGAVQAELRIAGLLPNLGPGRKWGFDLDGYKATLRRNLERELDYLDESRRQLAFRDAVQVRGLVVPRIYPELCRKGLLVQSYEAGETLEQARNFARLERLELARVLLETLFCSVFRAGQVHGDPHPGNYRFRLGDDGAEVVLYDYGCTVDIAPNASLALLRLIVSMREPEHTAPVDPLACFVELGFDERKLTEISEHLQPLSELLLQPFLAEGSFDVRKWRLSERLAERLGELRWWFRAAGPPSLFLLLRAFHGLALQLEALDVQLPWWPLLKRACGADRMAEARRSAAARAENASTASSASQVLARLMKVRVTRDGDTQVALSMPARAALRLEEIVPLDVQESIARNGTELAALQRHVEQTGLSPQTIFEVSENGRRIRVWLE